MVANEGQVVTDDNTASEGDADREAFVMAVSQPDRVRVVSVRATQRQQAEVSRTVGSERMVFFHDFVAVEPECVAHKLHDLMMWHRDVCLCPFGRVYSPQLLVADRVCASMN